MVDELVGNVGRKQTVISPKIVATVSGSDEENLRKSVPRIAAESGLKRSSTQKIIKNSLHMFPYKIQLHQAIPDRTEEQKLDFANRMLTMIYCDAFDVECIWFTNEGHFGLNGFVNKQN